MVLNKDFKEFIELLNERKVKYLVIGGYAVAYHGYPRYTKDIDFWIWLNKENAAKIIGVIKEFGFGMLGVTLEDFLDKNNVIQLGFPPVRIDLISDLSAVDFEECYELREKVDFDGLKVDFIDVNNLIKTKLAAGRPQDKVDADKLKEKLKEKELGKNDS